MIHELGWIGGYEIIIILVVVLLLFGGKKIPEFARGLGKGIRDFKDATDENNFKNDIKDVASEINDLKSSVKDIDPRNSVGNRKHIKSSK
ncbi:MAG: twin-arginine translocase TatA/TatE family subunit [Lentimicrobiaceae bacterium]|jgi:sec-independent protein translocase protein TatA|nr:twin-arginine translocase TatA/TatE family subunit [Lentimicrobiaceae bacterium]MCP4909865.1 twin-arginine translocase TatA/TatE family subunit [Bacteroidota bacterium]MBT3455069.1 twin-arginine translocase TatA/TatE family subunit [Lentimicrobiaceae bacterium]MBT3818185.1 twin-arginine translocase TatA/TatE family subunit [Lentimicrobiaceae bacterium]MBT4061731.1 twin-arginine translocase TatA/TatE family subunit [Lentimicrobiaceae bacterium]